ncbi:MAG TPA: response regulator, partial [Saprospiraceae bacterium]|nr:response regulator [Saprospiraceae bacterium]
AVKILAKLDSVQSSVEWLRNNIADLIFMDIQLTDGLSFSIFDQLKVQTPVIFTTAYDSYAIKAFKVNSIDYLLKPFNQERFDRAIA